MRLGCDSPARVLQGTRTLAAAFFATFALASPAMEDESDKLFSAWEPGLTLRAGTGYKDNVTLASKNEDASPFAHAAIEAVLLRLPVDGNQLTLSLIGEDTRYWEAQSVDHENLFLAQSEVRRIWENDWEASFGVDGFYLDQVVDFSITQTNREALPVRGGGLTARPGARRDLSDAVWLSLDLPATLQWYNDAVDDFWELGPRVTLGRTYGCQSEISAGYAFTHRRYDDDLARDSAGAIEEPNVTRADSQQDVSVIWKHHWDVNRRWRSTTKLGFRRSEDNAGGYFDYDRYEISHQLRYKTSKWELSAEAGLASYRFPVQTVSEIDLHHRRRADLRLTARAERQVAKYVRLYAQFEHEQTQSNDPLEEYTVNTVGGGISLEF